MRVLLPIGWPQPKGYSNAIEVRGRTIYVAGLVGWTAEEVFEAKDLSGQFEQILRNLITLLVEADAGPEHVVRMTWYITDKQAYRAEIKQIGAIYRHFMGKNYPAMAVVQVADLIEDEAVIEIEATVVVPE